MDESTVMEEIVIDRTSEDEEAFGFRVSVIDQTDRTIHDVTLTHLDYEEFGLASEAPERVVEFCFEFLLRRHPKESIRSRFDIRALSKSFPEFRDELRFTMLAEASLGDSS
jgi:hypothetical protein